MAEYTREQVEALLELYFDPERAYGLVVDTVPDSDMPRGTVSKAETGGWMAELIDIGRAWERAGLTVAERRRLGARHGLGLLFTELGDMEGVDERAIRLSCDRGINKILQFLNGRVIEGD